MSLINNNFDWIGSSGSFLRRGLGAPGRAVVGLTPRLNFKKFKNYFFFILKNLFYSSESTCSF